MHKNFFNYPDWIILRGFMVSCDQTTSINAITVTPDQPWIESTLKTSWADEEKAAEIMVDKENTLQVIDGFGACFNHLGWNEFGFKNPGGEILIIIANLTSENIRKIISSVEQDIEALLISHSITIIVVHPFI